MGKTLKAKKVYGNIKIMGALWEYRLYDEKSFIKKHPDCEDSGALVLLSQRQLHFTEEQLDMGTIRHEVRHAFTHELCIGSANLELLQFEEIQCTLDQNRWDEMQEVSTTIYENLTAT